MKLSKTLFALSLLVLSCSAYPDCAGNCQNGYGIYTYFSGDKYVGEWRDRKWHGQGTVT